MRAVLAAIYRGDNLDKKPKKWCRVIGTITAELCILNSYGMKELHS